MSPKFTSPATNGTPSTARGERRMTAAAALKSSSATILRSGKTVPGARVGPAGRAEPCGPEPRDLRASWGGYGPGGTVEGDVGDGEEAALGDRRAPRCVAAVRIIAPPQARLRECPPRPAYRSHIS
ncbi:hypothetical protein GCM10009672_02460 [Nesterenkonia lutea]